MEFRYMGFDQRNNTRAYRFDRVAKGEPTVRIVMTADLRLFLAHRIGIQEGPALCAHKLAGDPDSAASGVKELTNDDLLAYARARALNEAHRAEIRARGGRRLRPARAGS
jgi:hypothetical protein